MATEATETTHLAELLAEQARLAAWVDQIRAEDGLAAGFNHPPGWGQR